MKWIELKQEICFLDERALCGSEGTAAGEQDLGFAIGDVDDGSIGPFEIPLDEPDISSTLPPLPPPGS
ncbi:MAG: hypothetical protein HN750_03725 [Gemmatimonadales bacterium]|nr:hypothetical protein [Gemmatimonadota bacterium]MBT7691107.1 hypothetical protein [Gemmatimonadales bacterium]